MTIHQKRKELADYKPCKMISNENHHMAIDFMHAIFIRYGL